jgi:hypothetical protein
MLLFGHRFIENEKLYHINTIEDIAKTPANALLFLAFKEKNLELIKYLQTHSLRFALEVINITELIYAQNLGASLIVVPKTLVKTAQDIAENYLFDAKILVHVKQENEIEDYAKMGVDGVLFQEGIIKV